MNTDSNATQIVNATANNSGANTTNTTNSTVQGVQRLYDVSENAQESLSVVSLACWVVAFVFLCLFCCLRPWVRRVYRLRLFVGKRVYQPQKWIRNMFLTSATTAFSAGYTMDGCMHIVAWSMVARIFLWLSLLSPVLLLLNYNGSGTRCPDDTDALCNGTDTLHNGTDTLHNGTAQNSTTNASTTCGLGWGSDGKRLNLFWRLTMAEFQQCNMLIIGHVLVLWVITFIVLTELRRADRVFTHLRYKWFVRRSPLVVTSVMVVNATARNDLEFRETFERMFPGRVVDAKLVKFCPILVKKCKELEAVEDKLRAKAAIATEKDAQRRKIRYTAPEFVSDRRFDDVQPSTVQTIYEPLKVDAELGQKHEKCMGEKAAALEEVLIAIDEETEQIENLRVEEEKKRMDVKIDGQVIKQLKEALPKQSVFSRTGFATFKDMKTATLASQTSFSPDPKEWIMSVAPEPKDVLWHDMASKRASTNQERTYAIVVLSIIIFIAWFGVIAILQGLLDKGIRWFKDEVVTDKMKEHRMYTTVTGFLDPVLKTLVLIVFMSFLPSLLYSLIVFSGRMVKNVALLELQNYLVLFETCFVIYANSIGLSLQSVFDHVLSGFDPNQPIQKFEFSKTFGTAVPSAFPVLYTYAAGSLGQLAMGLFQLPVIFSVIIHRITRQPPEFSWSVAVKKNVTWEENPVRFVLLTVCFAIGLMIYQVFPPNVFLFLGIFCLGAISFRYRVLYIDTGLVDSGGMFWAQFEIHVVVVLLAVHVTGSIVMYRIMPKLWITVCTLPLPFLSALFLLKLRRKRWNVLSARFPELHDRDQHVEDPSEFGYVQPHLQHSGTSNARVSIQPKRASVDPEGWTSMNTGAPTGFEGANRGSLRERFQPQSVFE